MTYYSLFSLGIKVMFGQNLKWFTGVRTTMKLMKINHKAESWAIRQVYRACSIQRVKMLKINYTRGKVTSNQRSIMAVMMTISSVYL